MLGEPDGPHGEVPALKRVLFRAAFRRTPRTSFNVRGSPVIYAVLAVGCPWWMVSWQGWQTTRVLRLYRAKTRCRACEQVLLVVELGRSPVLVDHASEEPMAPDGGVEQGHFGGVMQWWVLIEALVWAVIIECWTYRARTVRAEQKRNGSGLSLIWLFARPFATVVDQWRRCSLVNRVPSQHRAKWEPNMGGIWEDRSDVNRGVPRRTARYGAGATCRFSVSGGRGRARAALGVKGSQVRILSSRRS